MNVELFVGRCALKVEEQGVGRCSLKVEEQGVGG